MADKNYESYAGQNGVVVEGRKIDGGPGYNDMLKFSDCTNFRVTECYIVGGSEDCVDMNRGKGGLIENTMFEPRGSFALTAKGGFSNLHLRNVMVRGRGKETTIDLGNWSDQAPWKMTKNIVLENLTSEDGSPVSVRVLWAQKPKVIGGNVRVEDARLKAFFYFVYKTILSWFK